MKLKSNERIHLISIDGGKDFVCNPNQEFIPPKGKFKLWGDVHIVDEDNDNKTVCHLRVLDFKEGINLPEELFPVPVAKVKSKPKLTEASND